MDWFILINEEKLFDPHEILGEPDTNWQPDDLAFLSPSPVETYDGMYSGRFKHPVCLVVRWQFLSSFSSINFLCFPSTPWIPQ